MRTNGGGECTDSTLVVGRAWQIYVGERMGGGEAVVNEKQMEKGLVMSIPGLPWFQ